MPRSLYKFPGLISYLTEYTIRMSRIGCKNRQFYTIVVTSRKGRAFEGDVIEQLGSFDPIPNDANEKVCAVNWERMRYWIAKDASISPTVLELLGLAGWMPVHPRTFIRAKHNRKKAAEIAAKAEASFDKATSSSEQTENAAVSG